MVVGVVGVQPFGKVAHRGSSGTPECRPSRTFRRPVSVLTVWVRCDCGWSSSPHSLLDGALSGHDGSEPGYHAIRSCERRAPPYRAPTVDMPFPELPEIEGSLTGGGTRQATDDIALEQYEHHQ
jgi:hypothetical protein